MSAQPQMLANHRRAFLWSLALLAGCVASLFLVGRHPPEVAPLVAPVHLLIRDAAATDPEMAALLRDSDRQRRERMRDNARTLADRGHLKPGITLEDATDVMWTYSAPELYELLVIRCGWNLTRYGRFLAESIAAALLPEA